ncbi:MATE family efflux transporter [Methanobrevibacter sp.]|uniref:MATE family efflux transporter n=1 Tax=Methanobrevibacter sp. TaxID=66852 RepID=UPI00386ACBC6
MDKNIDLVSNPKKSFYNLSIPLVAFALFNTLYSVIDTMWISTYSDEAIIALSVCIPVFALYTYVGDSFGQGTNSIMSRYLGSGNYKNACSSFLTGMLIVLVIYISILLISTQYAFIFGIWETEYLDSVLSYIMPMSIFSFVFLYSNFFSETMQAEGNSKFPTMLLIATNILNLILDPVFIHYFNLGVRGAAYASILSASICFIILLLRYVLGKNKIEFSLKYLKIRLYVIGEIIKVALPNCFEDGASTFSILFIYSILIGVLGFMGISLYLVCDSLKKLFLSPVKGFGRGLLSVSGHLFGAKKFDDIKKLYLHALKLSMLVSFVISIFVFIFFKDILALFDMADNNFNLFLIAVSAVFLLSFSPVALISGKILDGFGKSYYSLFFKILKKAFEIIVIILLVDIFKGSSILIAFISSELIFACVYYLFVVSSIKKVKVVYHDADVVKSF